MKSIKLTQNKIAIVDDDDYLQLSSHSWFFVQNRSGPTGYARRGQKLNGRTVSMHRLIMKLPEGMVVHHKNGNGLDNRKENLCLITPSTHARIRRVHLRKNNTSGVEGVKWRNRKKPWYAVIRTKWLGSFSTKEEAIEARKKAEKDHDKSISF